MPESTPSSPLQHLAGLLPELKGAKRRVAEVVLGNPSRVAHSTITWLAAEASTTPGTVTRLAFWLGYAGFPAFRAAIATDNGRESQVAWERDIGGEIAVGDSPERILSLLGQYQYRAMQNAIAEVDTAALHRIAEWIAAARHVHVFGSWGDQVPAEELQLRLLRIGVPAWLHSGESTVRFGGRLLDSNDVVLVFSRIGENADAQQFLERARRNGAHSVLITGSDRSTLAEEAETVIFTGTKSGSYWTDYFQGRSSDTLVASLLWVLVSQRTPAAGQHPPFAERDA